MSRQTSTLQSCASDIAHDNAAALDKCWQYDHIEEMNPYNLQPESQSKTRQHKECYDVDEQEARARLQERMMARDNNYGGTHSIKRARERERAIVADMNCSLFITNLNSDVSVQEIFDGLPRLGRVLSLHINRPIIRYDPSEGPHRPNSAASVAFFFPEPARLILRRAASQPLVIGGREVLVRVNENPSAPQYNLLGCTRVLLIEGSRLFANREFLGHYLRLSEIHWDDDRVIVTPLDDGRQRLEWRFASYRNQAEASYRVISTELADILSVEFGRDPCSPPIT